MYTREINLDAETEKRLISYIEDELIRHYAERGDLINQISLWQVDYDAAPSQTEGTWPFKGAATLIIPLAAINVEAIHARTITTAFALSQFVSAKPKSSQWQKHARPVEQFLDDELLKRIGIKKPINDSILEIIKYGTGVAKTGYCKITKVAVRETNDGGEEEFPVTIKQGATVDAVPLGRFLMPFVYQDPQTAAWCGEEHEYTPYEVRLHEVGGLFKKGTVEKLSNHYSTVPSSDGNTGSENQTNQEKMEKREPVWPSKLMVHELWLGFDTDKSEELWANGMIGDEAIQNGFDKEIVVQYHKDSRQIISCRYNWHHDLRRPYHSGVYFPVEHRWAGIGVCKQVEQFQREITTQHRQRIDNATLANCRMIKVNSLSKYGPDEPVFPGKMWFLDNPKDDIDTFQLGEIYPSSYSNEQQALLFLQQRTGINEVNLGMPQSGTPGTATSDLARIQEGNKKFDYTYQNIRTFIDDVIKSTILNIKQFGRRNVEYYNTVENGVLVKEFFDQEYDVIKDGLTLEIVLAGQQDNKLLDRQNVQQIAQMLTGYYDSMIGLAQMTGDQALMQQIAKRGMEAGTEAMRQFLETFDLRNVDRLTLSEILNGVTAINQQGGSGGLISAQSTQGIQLPSPAVPAQPQY